jgi:transketolase
MALYAILQEISLINDSWITDFSKFESRFGGHPDRNKVQGVTASTGSLGHGLSIAVGLALANRNLNQKKLVFCLVGDGEMNEGSIWESLLVATHHNLSNLTIIIDNNQSSTRALKLPNIGKVLKDMEFNVYEVDGHNLKKIITAITISNINLKPKIIIANTIKGFGIPQLENNPAWHHLSPSESEYVQMVQDLK